MKKRFLMILLAGLMLFSLATPAMAYSAELDVSQGYVEIAPLTEYTRIYFRNLNVNGQPVLQFRVWGITSGRWLTDWINF